MRAQFTHLYRVKSSKNYFFRIRTNFFKKMSNHSFASEHFVASLKTKVLDEALWLASFIKRKIMEDVKMHTQTLNNIQIKALAQLNHDIDSIQLEIELNRFLKDSFNHWLQVGKKMIQFGVIAPGALAELRTVPEATIRETFDDNMGDEIPVTVHSRTLWAFEAESKRLGGSLEPRRDEALMVNRLIAEFQKLARKQDRYDHEMVSATPVTDPIEGVEFLQLLETMKRFTASFRRTERKFKTERNVNLQLSVCIENFCKSKFKEVGYSAQQQYKKSFDVLCSILDPTYLVTELDRQIAIKVKNKIMELPSGRTVRGKKTTLSVKSVNKYLTNYFTFCAWLVDSMQLITSNPFSNMQLSLKEAKHQAKRRQFSLTEISRLLSYSPSDKREAADFRDAAFWLPKISLYSGMRLNEAAGLKIRDIYVVNGIWVFDLSEHQLKNEHSKRLVPVHSKLIQLGLLDFCEKQKAASEFMLFPELQSATRLIGRDGLGTPVSKWFNRTVLPKICINKDAERDLGLLIDFHCTRTTVASYFKRHGVNAYVVKQILGHVDDDITFGVYGGNEQVSLSVLKDTIELISY